MPLLRLPALRPFLSLLAGAMLLLPPALAADVATAPLRYDTSQAIARPVLARHGMVVSEQALASAAGQEILQRGGTAVDAAVAVGFALAVVLPNAGNLGGGGFMLLHDARHGRQVALDFRERAPRAATRDMYLDATGQVSERRARYSHQAVGVPGSVAGLCYAQQHYGSLPLARVIAPAIRLAERGFLVTPHLADILEAERDHLAAWPATRAIFFREGQPLRAGARLRQPDLARALRQIARQGADAFYRGPIAQKLLAEMRAHDGLIDAQDLRDYQVIERQPVTGQYRGYQIVSMPPPSSGGVHIVQMLQVLEGFPLAQWGSGSAQTLHVLAEVMKRAYADRSEYLGDPDAHPVPVAQLLAPAYAHSIREHIDLERATPSGAIRPGQNMPHESDQTTHYSVADRFGNVVATTYTLNLNFGSGIVIPGTGILLNDEMDDFSAKPGAPNAFDLLGGEANAIAPGKRPLSSMSPTLVLRNGQVWLATGSPGGSRIISTTLQMLVNVIDFGMNIAEATLAPRMHHQWWPDQLRVERGISPDTLALLRARGQQVLTVPTMGRTQTLARTAGQLEGYADPRNPDGAALGY